MLETHVLPNFSHAPGMVRLARVMDADRLGIHVLENSISTAYFDEATAPPAAEIQSRLIASSHASPENKMPLLSLTLLPKGESIETYNDLMPFESNVGYLIDLTQTKDKPPAAVICVNDTGLWSGDDTRKKIATIFTGLEKFNLPGVKKYYLDMAAKHISPEEAAAREEEGVIAANRMLNELAEHVHLQKGNIHEMNEVVAAVSKEHCIGIAIPMTQAMKNPFFEHWAILKACALALKEHEQGRFLPIVAYDNQNKSSGLIPLAANVSDVVRLLHLTEERRKTLETQGAFFNASGSLFSALRGAKLEEFNAIVNALNVTLGHYEEAASFQIKSLTPRELISGAKTKEENLLLFNAFREAGNYISPQSSQPARSA